MENLKNVMWLLCGFYIGVSDGFKSLFDGYEGFDVLIVYAVLGVFMLGVFYVIDFIFDTPRILREYLGCDESK